MLCSEIYSVNIPYGRGRLVHFRKHRDNRSQTYDVSSNAWHCFRGVSSCEPSLCTELDVGKGLPGSTTQCSYTLELPILRFTLHKQVMRQEFTLFVHLFTLCSRQILEVCAANRLPVEDWLLERIANKSSSCGNGMYR